VGRTFQHLNRAWDVELTGTSHGVASGFPPNTTSWGVRFKPVDDPSAEPVYGSIWRPDPTQLSEDDLRKSLESALVAKALEDPNWDWRTVKGVADDTGLTEERVRALLESSTSVLRSSVPDKKGRSLYTTRQHYKKRRSFLDSLRTT
jgi:hypothetical protein